MSRHRKERVRKRRAGRRTDRSSRPAQFSAVTAEAGPGTDEAIRRTGSRAEDPSAILNATLGDGAAADHTVPLAGGAGWYETVCGPEQVESGPRHVRDREPSRAAGRRDQQRSMIRGAAHSLLVTPWFAAGAACVIAAALWLTAPHSSLTLIDPIVKVPCMNEACVSAVIDGTGTPDTTTHGTTEHDHHSSGRSTAGSGGAGTKFTTSGVTVVYRVLYHRDGKYAAKITIKSGHALGRWKLAFRIPGTHIDYVLGATWNASGNHAGGTASALKGPGRYHHRRGGGWNGSGASDRGVSAQSGVGLQGSRLDAADGGRLGGQTGMGPDSGHGTGSGGQSGGDSPGRHRGHPRGGAGHVFSVQFVIYGTGSPGTPVGCTFDGTSFTFSS
jgi:hypothetical protein